MKNPFRFSILPYFTLGAGALGLCLRFWLFSATDEKGLLPFFHIADPLLYILTALTLGVLFLSCRQRCGSPFRPGFMRLWALAGDILGGVCLLAAVVCNLRGGAIGTIGCLLSALAMLTAALWRLMKKAAPYWLFTILTAALMLCIIAQCREWGAEPQLQAYFFPLMAAVFAILAAYHRTLLAAGQKKQRLLAFFSQGCLFFSFLSLNTSQWPLYLGLLCWSSALILPCYRKKKEE